MKAKRKTWIGITVAAALVIAGVVAFPPLHAWWQDRTWESAVEDAGDAASWDDGALVFTSDPRPSTDACRWELEVEARSACYAEVADAYNDTFLTAAQAAEAFAEQVGLDDFAGVLDDPTSWSGNLVETYDASVGQVRAEYAVDRDGQFSAYFERLE